MNSFKELNKRKLLIVAGTALLIIVAVIVALVTYKGGNGSVKPVITKPSGANVNTPNKVWKNDGTSYKYDGPVPTQPAVKQEPVAIGLPTQLFGGTVADYKDNSTNAELVIAIGGDTTRQKKFTMQVGSIVFDASKSVVMLPSQLTKGQKIRVITAGEVAATAPNAVVVIVNDDPSLSYTSVTGVEKGTDSITLLDNATKTKYVLSVNSPVLNALTGVTYDKTSLKAGDRLFFYEGKPENLSGIGKDAPKASVSPAENRGSVSKDGKITSDKPITDDTSTYTVVNVKKAYVYPSPQ